MRNLIDFSSWQGALSAVLGLVVFTLVAVGIRLLVMQRVQARRERQNRQINERLKTLIAAYKTLGGSFTGNLAVDPSHLRELRLRAAVAQAAVEAAQGRVDLAQPSTDAAPGSVDAAPHVSGPGTGDTGSDRGRRTRDAVEAALSDVILLGTQEQVRLAAQAAQDMVAGRTIETGELVRSLRVFIREVLDLEALPDGLSIPNQGPVRAAGASARGAGAQGGAGRGGGGGQGGGGGGMAAGGLMGMGAAQAPAAQAVAGAEPDARLP